MFFSNYLLLFSILYITLYYNDIYIVSLYLGGDDMNTLLAQEIHDKALACGYDDCGIVPLDALDLFIH